MKRRNAYDGPDLPQGTTGSSYSPADDGPFACGLCIHFHNAERKNPRSVLHILGTCDHPAVEKDAAAGEIEVDEQGRALVEFGGCCAYMRN